MGELSAARHALEGDPIAPGNRQTLSALQDPERRPPVPRKALQASIINHFPQTEINLDNRFLDAEEWPIRHDSGAHQGGVGVRTRLLFIVAHVSRICKGSHAARDSPGGEDWPVDSALQKPQGSIRGTVVGDFIRRVVARTLAQQLGPAVEQHTSPFQFALPTRSGCECVAHIA